MDENNTNEQMLFANSNKEYQEPSIYTPEFIPYYVDAQQKYHLTDKETLLYGFIRFYLKNSSSNQFYFSNEQLAKVLGVKNEDYVSQLFISLVKKCPEIEVSYDIKAGGGKIRFVKFLGSELRKNYVQNLEKSKVNNNKINNNKINNKTISNEIVESDPIGKEINSLLGKFQKINPASYKLFANKTQRKALERLIHAYGTEKVGQLIDFLQISNQEKYAPIITTPLELENKLGKLLAFIKQKQKDNSREIFITF